MPHHYLSKSKVYGVWCGIKSRCTNSKNPAYKYYGGRGIDICEEWKFNFLKFFSDMGHPQIGETIDRIDNNLGYYKGNCRWVSRKVQMNNRRCNIFVEFEGRKMTIMQWSEEKNIPHQTLSERFHRGLSPEDILSPEKFFDFSGLALGGIANGKKQRIKTHCKRGHKFNEKNTLVDKKGNRSCRRCHADRENVRRKINETPVKRKV